MSKQGSATYFDGAPFQATGIDYANDTDGTSYSTYSNGSFSADLTLTLEDMVKLKRALDAKLEESAKQMAEEIGIPVDACRLLLSGDVRIVESEVDGAYLTEVDGKPVIVAGKEWLRKLDEASKQENER